MRPNQNQKTSLLAVRPVLRKAEVAAVFGVNSSTIDRWVAAGALPKPQRLGAVPFWRPEIIEEVIARAA